MQLYDFYQLTLPPTGHYAIFRAKTQRHIWCDTLNELVEHTNSFKDLPDTYFATASFTEATSRSQANVARLKALRLDLDAGAAKLAKHGEDKVYATRDDALADLIRFSRETGVLPSLIVGSGDGLHVYYVLEESVSAAVWVPLAQEFKRFVAAHGLKADPAVTADSARILRPIGTKHPNGKTVTVIKATGKTYTPQSIGELIAYEPVPVTPKYDTSINDDIPEVQGPPKSISKVLKACGAAMHAALNQTTIEEPYWRAMIGLAKHTLQGRGAAHKLSEQHPKYSAKQTDDYYDRWATGPTTCERFAEFNSTACAACPSKGKIKSPIQLGAMTVVEVEKLPEAVQPTPVEPKKSGNPWDGHIPAGFDVVQQKGRRTLVQYLDTTKENEDGDPVPIRVTVPFSHEVFWLGQWADPADPNDVAQVTVHSLLHSGRIERFRMNQEILASLAETAKFLASKGIHTTVDKRAMTAQSAFLKEMLQGIKNSDRQPKIVDRFGITYTPEGELIAVQGENAITADGTILRCSLSNKLSKARNMYTIPIEHNDDGVWGKEVWRERIMPSARTYVEFVKRWYSAEHLKAYRTAFMLNCASPLMAFAQGGYLGGEELRGPSLTISLFSKDGGKGKTTLMNVMSMVYGTPAARNDRNRNATTNLARDAYMSISGNLPAYMDEMGNVEAGVLGDLVETIANGCGRIRLKQGGELMQGTRWSLICIAATNQSIRELVAQARGHTNAVLYRMLELDVQDLPDMSADDRGGCEKDIIAMYPHFGSLGAVINLMICRKGGEAITAMVHDNVAKARRILASKQIDRFTDYALGSMITVHELLESQGLAPFDLNEMIETFRLAQKSGEAFAVENISSSNGLELLSKMLNDLQPYTTITTHQTRINGTSKRYDVAINHGGRVPDKLKARHVTSLGKTYVSVDAMREWCAAASVSITDIMAWAKKGNVVQHVYASDGMQTTPRWSSNFNLATGMAENAGGQGKCYCFSITALDRAMGTDYGRQLLNTIDVRSGAPEEAKPVETDPAEVPTEQ